MTTIWPQVIMVALQILSFTSNVFKDSRSRDPGSKLFGTFVGAASQTALLIWGGFYTPLLAALR